MRTARPRRTTCSLPSAIVRRRDRSDTCQFSATWRTVGGLRQRTRFRQHHLGFASLGSFGSVPVNTHVRVGNGFSHRWHPPPDPRLPRALSRLRSPSCARAPLRHRHRRYRRGPLGLDQSIIAAEHDQPTPADPYGLEHPLVEHSPDGTDAKPG